MNNKFMKTIVLGGMLCLSPNVFAAFPTSTPVNYPLTEEGVIPPAAEGTKFFNNSTVDNSAGSGGGIVINGADKDTDIIGQDTLPKEDIDKGLFYSQNYGAESTGTNVIDSSGNRVYVERIGVDSQHSYTGVDQIVDNPKNSREYTEWSTSVEGLEYAETKGVSMSMSLFALWKNDSEEKINPLNVKNDLYEEPEYQTYQEKYQEFVLDNDIDNKRANENDAKERGMAENYRSGNTVNEWKNRFLDNINVVTDGQSVAQTFTTEQEVTNDELNERDKEATLLYKDLYSTGPNSADKENLLNTNYGALSKAFEGVDAIAEKLTERLTGGNIECQISRELIPSYKCDLPGKDGIMYPGAGAGSDLRNVNILEAKDECNGDCHTEPGELSCVGETMLTSRDIGISLGSNVELFPTWSESVTTKNFVIDNIMPVEHVTFRIEIPKPDTYTLEEWNKIIAESGFNMRYSVLETNYEIDNLAPITIVDRAAIRIRSSSMEIKVNIDRAVNGLRIKFWKPYIANNELYAFQYKHFFDFIQSEGSRIEITSLEGEYPSDSFYYCQAKQMVASPNECTGGDVHLFETTADQSYYLCSAEERKIDPDPIWGAFYDLDTCQTTCVIDKPCEPTYRHYTSYGSDDFLYKAVVSCVKSDTNTNCTQSLCEGYFADTDLRPINEILVANDDTYKYTIKSKVLTNVTRPKIDLDSELGGSVDYDQTFELEQKDAAYLAMLEKLTYNRIPYRVGTESPWNIAVIKEDTVGRTGFSIDLKPNSFDYDNGVNNYVYSVMRILHSYTPTAGVWHLNGSSVNAKTSQIQWEDYSYLIKTGNGEEDWELFRREEFVQVLIKKFVTTINDAGEAIEEEYIDWVPTKTHTRVQFANYNLADNSFSILDENSPAKYFERKEFSSVQDFFRFPITNSVEKVIDKTPGSLVKDQIPIAHETDFEKLYNLPPHNYKRSNPKDYVLYLMYSPTELSYNDIMTQIEGADYNGVKKLPQNVKPGAYQLVASNLFRTGSIEYDKELNNDINPLIKGTPDNTSVSVDWEPSISEKGKKVFKYLFLYDDVTNPFTYTNDDGTAPGQTEN